jgi:hypothetical protein
LGEGGLRKSSKLKLEGESGTIQRVRVTVGDTKTAKCAKQKIKDCK